MLRESRRNQVVEAVVFFTAKEPKPTRSFLPLPHQTGGIDGHFAIANALAIAE